VPKAGPIAALPLGSGGLQIEITILLLSYIPNLLLALDDKAINYPKQ
jgi:hypothetical protein